MNSVVGDGAVYAQLARGVRCAEDTLTLVDLSPSTIWMSPAPRSLWFLPTGAFLDRWDEAQPADTSARRIQGTLALLDADSQLTGDARLMLSRPRMTATGLTYDVEVQTGLLPSKSGACVLFLEWDSPPT